jgi:hypothetical protein
MALRLAALLALCMLCMRLQTAHATEAGVQDDEYEDTERALLVVHKAVGLQLRGGLAFPLIVEGRNVNLSITVHNAGAGWVHGSALLQQRSGRQLHSCARRSGPRRPASDIVLTDVVPSNARLVDGSVTGSCTKSKCCRIPPSSSSSALHRSTVLHAGPKLSSGSRHTLNYTGTCASACQRCAAMR